MSAPTASNAGSGTLGYIEVLVAAMMWGSSGPMSVALMRMGVEPETLALLRPLLGAVFLLAFGFFWTGEARPRPNRRDLVYLLLFGGAIVGSFQLVFQLSTEAVGVPTTVGLLYLAPAIVVIASGPLLGEWPKALTFLLAVLSVAGVWLMVLGASAAGTGGNLVWGVLCGILFASYTLFGRWMSPRLGPLRVTLYTTVGGGAVLLMAWSAGLMRVAVPPTESWWLLLVFALTTLSISSLLYFDGLRRIEAGHAAIIATVEPLTASIIAALLLGQAMAPVGWGGLLLVVAGVAGAYAIGGRAVEPH